MNNFPHATAIDNLPLDLKHPGGLVETVFSYIDRTARCRQPLFALGAALTFCGLLFGRRYRDETDQRTNLFTFVIGHTSAGKDHAIKSIIKMLDAGEATHLFISQITSDSAAEYALKRNPRLLFLIDEAGHFFSSVNDPGSGALKSVKPSLLQLWSSANTVWKGKQRAPQREKDEPPIEIRNPHVCLLGTTQPQTFFEGATRRDIQDGWLARPIIFLSTTRPRPKTGFIDDTVPAEIVETVSRFNAEDATGELRYVASSDEARNILEAFSNDIYEKMQEADRGQGEISYIYGKAVENARRIAMIIAIGKNEIDPIISGEDMRYAVALVKYTIMTAVSAIEDNVAENETERSKKRVLKTIREAKDAGITRGQLSRKTQFLNQDQRDKIIDDLLLSDLIASRKGANGREIFVYKPHSNE